MSVYYNSTATDGKHVPIISETITKTTETRSHTTPNHEDKPLSSLTPISPSAISDSSVKSPKSPKTTKSEKQKLSMSSVSESLRKDAKFPCGKETKSDDDEGKKSTTGD